MVPVKACVSETSPTVLLVPKELAIVVNTMEIAAWDVVTPADVPMVE